MRIFLYQDGDQLIELVEKRELGDLISLLASEKSTRNHLIKRGAELERELNAAKQELQDAVERMENVSVHKLEDLFCMHVTDWAQGIEAVRIHLIQAAKGEQP